MSPENPPRPARQEEHPKKDGAVVIRNGKVFEVATGRELSPEEAKERGITVKGGGSFVKGGRVIVQQNRPSPEAFDNSRAEQAKSPVVGGSSMHYESRPGGDSSLVEDDDGVHVLQGRSVVEEMVADEARGGVTSYPDAEELPVVASDNPLTVESSPLEKPAIEVKKPEVLAGFDKIDFNNPDESPESNPSGSGGDVNKGGIEKQREDGGGSSSDLQPPAPSAREEVETASDSGSVIDELKALVEDEEEIKRRLNHARKDVREFLFYELPELSDDEERRAEILEGLPERVESWRELLTEERTSPEILRNILFYSQDRLTRLSGATTPSTPELVSVEDFLKDSFAAYFQRDSKKSSGFVGEDVAFDERMFDAGIVAAYAPLFKKKEGKIQADATSLYEDSFGQAAEMVFDTNEGFFRATISSGHVDDAMMRAIMKSVRFVVESATDPEKKKRAFELMLDALSDGTSRRNGVRSELTVLAKDMKVTTEDSEQQEIYLLQSIKDAMADVLKRKYGVSFPVRFNRVRTSRKDGVEDVAWSTHKDEIKDAFQELDFCLVKGIEQIIDLERVEPGAAKILHDQFDIREFGRYALRMLVAQYRERDDKEKEYGVVMAPGFEGGLVFYSLDQYLGEAFDALAAKGVGMRIVESDNLLRLGVNLLKLKKNYTPKMAFAVMAGHGGLEGKGFELSLNRPLLTEDFFSENYLQQVGQILKPDAPVLVMSCQTGADGGFAQMLSQRHSGPVHAPADIARVNLVYVPLSLEAHSSLRAAVVDGVVYFEPNFVNPERKPVNRTFASGIPQEIAGVDATA